jgi:hypothetical protein
LGHSSHRAEPGGAYQPRSHSSREVPVTAHSPRERWLEHWEPAGHSWHSAQDWPRLMPASVYRPGVQSWQAAAFGAAKKPGVHGCLSTPPGQW